MNIKAYSTNIGNFNSTNITKLGGNLRNKEEVKRASKGNESLKVNEQSNKKNKALENLEKSKHNYLEQRQNLIAKETTKEFTFEEKKIKIAEIDKNIRMVESQIQQLNIQQKEEEAQKKQAEIEKKKRKEDYKKGGDENRGDIIVESSLKDLIKLSSSKDNIHRLKDIKNREAVEALYIEYDNNPKTFNNRRMTQIYKSAVNIDNRISGEIRKINIEAKSIRDNSVVNYVNEVDENENEKIISKEVEKTEVDK